MTAPIVVQARDGRWVFGHPRDEAALRAKAKGDFATAADASQAATEATRELPLEELATVRGGVA